MIERIASGEFHSMVFSVIEVSSLLIESLAVAIIVVSVLGGTVLYIYRILVGRKTDDPYTRYKNGLAKSMLLGLEILVAADVVRTVALEPTLTSVGVLGLLVLIRTFLSWSLAVETEGRWPWQQRADAGEPERQGTSDQ